MENAAILHIRSLAYDDEFAVATNHRIKPDANFFLKLHIADYVCARCDPEAAR